MTTLAAALPRDWQTYTPPIPAFLLAAASFVFVPWYPPFSMCAWRAPLDARRYCAAPVRPSGRAVHLENIAFR